MKAIRFAIAGLWLFTGALFAIVGDWTSYGSQLTLRDLHLSGSQIIAGSHGGIVIFDTQNRTFNENTATYDLEHIDILEYYVNTDGSEWFSYGSGVNGISYKIPGENSNYFDFEFTEASAFTGNNNNVLVAYNNDFTPEIAHFVKRNNRFIFQDIYNQFPGSPSQIYNMTLSGDSLYLATDKGLISSWLYGANLKPESAWTKTEFDSIDAIEYVFSTGDSLYLVNETHDLYLYQEGQVIKILDEDAATADFLNLGNKLYYATQRNIIDISTLEQVYNTDGVISGFMVTGDTLWVAEENEGLKQVNLSTGNRSSFVPNTMLYSKANSLAITADQKLAVCGLEGISILENGHWHNLMFSPYEEHISNERPTDFYSADTLNIAWRTGGQTTVYDAMISSQNELWCSITDISTYKYSGQPDNAKGPGALQRINLDDLSEYTVYDTSEGIVDGTQELGGSPYYLKMRGISEDRYGNIWALNVHTLAGETLLKFRTDGDILKYSVSDSDDQLEILAREMVFDQYGRLWIANEARQSDVPRTTGGITVFDPNTDVWSLITTSDGLASNDVYSIDIDPLTGNIWAATASGVQMIRTPTSFNAQTEFSMNPPIDGLSGMVPVKLRIDPKGNKWILTQSQGVQIYMTNNRWFDEGNGLSTENSELLDDVVYDIEFDTKNGYAYLLTPSGLSRYEIAWTEERTDMNEVIVFPQPFKPGTDPYIAIDGLAEQSHVRITTLDGRVLIQFAANAAENREKQIVWDGVLPSGEYISRGVYLIFITNIDGLKKTLKFAVE